MERDVGDRLHNEIRWNSKQVYGPCGSVVGAPRRLSMWYKCIARARVRNLGQPSFCSMGNLPMHPPHGQVARVTAKMSTSENW